jgi:hypothetical protein
MPTSEWHWEQGTKFAVEGIKTSLLLNGAAAIALMTFANAHTISVTVRFGILLFAVGAMFSAIAFLAAYFTQLEYGNAEVPGMTPEQHIQAWKKGERRNLAAILFVLLSVAMFFFGSAVVLQTWPIT